MKTAFVLLAQYDGLAVVPADRVCRDYFPHLTPEKFARKVALGQISIPMVKIEGSQKSARGIHIQDLADYLDKRRDEARREYNQMSR